MTRARRRESVHLGDTPERLRRRAVGFYRPVMSDEVKRLLEAFEEIQAVDPEELAASVADDPAEAARLHSLLEQVRAHSAEIHKVVRRHHLRPVE